MKKTVPVLLSSLFCLQAAAAEPVVIFSDTFDDLAQWGAPNNPGETRIIEVTTENSETTFGETDDSYLRVFKGTNESGTNAISANNVFSDPSPVVTVAFDFWNSSEGAGQIVLRPGGATANNNDRIHEIGFARGILSNVAGVYDPDQTHRIEIVLNNSTEAVHYSDYYTVASDSFDVWINGIRVLNDHTRSRGSLPVGADIASLQFATFTTNWGELLVDDLVVYSGAHVTPASPEPLPAFADTFESLESPWGSPTNQLAGARVIEVTDVDAETYFGEAGNSYLRIFKDDADVGAASMLITAINAVSSPVVSVSFDFWQNSAVGPEGSGFSFRAGQGTSVPNSHRVHNLMLKDGFVNGREGLYTTDGPNSIQVVYNNTADPVSYLNGAVVLAADAMDVWLNGDLVLKDEQYSRGSLAVGDPLRSFQFVGFTGDVGEFFVDDFQVYDMAIVTGVEAPGLPEVTITDLTHQEFSFDLSFTSETGYSYAVEYTDDLASGNWQSLATHPGTGEIITSTDWGMNGKAARFYRVTVSPGD